MKIGKKAQYALMFTLYLARAGRANVATASENLGVSSAFLEQIARQLRIAGILTVKRGPGGGYELSGTPTIGDVLKAVGQGALISQAETEKLMRGGIESRTTANIIGTLSLNLSRLLRTSLEVVGKDAVREEVAQLNSATETASPN